ncbi:MAG: hypothetical protein ACRDAX_06345 [Propionibacteriaceae bacterium]
MEPSKSKDCSWQEDAQNQLNQIAQTRTAAVKISMRPWWVDAVFGVIAAAAMVLIIRRLWIAATILGVVGVISLFLLYRNTKREGYIADERAVGVNAIVSAAVSLLMISAIILIPKDVSWQILLALGVAQALLIFVCVRIREHYQVRRLAAKDYGKYDLI